MKHVVVFLHPDTVTLEIALQWPFLSPIGPRLEKAMPMPALETRGYTDVKKAMEAARIFDEWLTRQEAGERGPWKPKSGEAKMVEPIVLPAAKPVDLVLQAPVERKAPPPKTVQEDLFTGTF